MVLVDELDDFVPEPCEAILVGNHNFFEFSRHCFDQYGLQSFSIEINSRTNILNNRLGRMKLLEASVGSWELWDHSCEVRDDHYHWDVWDDHFHWDVWDDHYRWDVWVFGDFENCD